MNEKNENAIKGFETISPLTHGMSFLPQKGLISRVEQNCSHKNRNNCVKSIEGEATETNSITTIEGFGDMAFVTLGVLFSSQKEGYLVRLNDARNNKLTSAEEICKRNIHLVEEYYTSEQDDISGTNNQSGIFDYDLGDCDELVHDDLQQVPQETFG